MHMENLLVEMQKENMKSVTCLQSNSDKFHSGSPIAAISMLRKSDMGQGSK